ncbi:zinc finger, C2H2 type family protein (macronuclear) [Tetrahymena thermophila SB210]|uniref:Zinc finger, C2H2 type family protein n=1 Tax=Tetrahymena thermophila (strain SB210) TaxID=312017 RepID=Q22SM9_TETTS|nr:zinc finger, C2H2 type family protein [Tetrahymena thermophila SB210]EAR87743.1 zinc finger, C2H2 type family protein [Tetrahymena thermophila SB210]|eukprot:XP_001007988.1 zinc finger, C2H2 type family protein [Tetrahymena thermophila SB210]
MEKKKFICRCGKNYERNASLFNHIRLKHNNDKKNFNLTNAKVGRPLDSKNLRNKPKQTPAKQLVCKCGKTLQGEGSLSNHIRIKHNNDPQFQIQKKQQGRKKGPLIVSFSENNNQEILFSTQLITEQFTNTLDTQRTEQIYPSIDEYYDQQQLDINYQQCVGQIENDNMFMDDSFRESNFLNNQSDHLQYSYF